MYTEQSISKGVIDVYAKSEKITDVIKRYDICTMGVACPIEAGTEFVLPLTEIPKYELEVIILIFLTFCRLLLVLPL